MSATYLTLTFSGALVLVGIIQAWVYWKQSKLMRESIDEARKSSERQLRAYINVSESKQVTVVMRKDHQQFCDIVIKNCGQTPAYDLIAVGEFNGSLPIGQSFPISAINRSEYQGGKSVLNPQSEIVLQCKIGRQKYPPLPSPQGNTMYVFGRVEYQDAFGNDRFTNFCFVLGKPGNNLTAETIAYTYYHVRTEWGNEAD